MNSCETIRTAMMAYDWIGFDLFDTLLFRPFWKPDDLFCQMEQELGRTGFAALRSGTAVSYTHLTLPTTERV